MYKQQPKVIEQEVLRKKIKLEDLLDYAYGLWLKEQNPNLRRIRANALINLLLGACSSLRAVKKEWFRSLSMLREKEAFLGSPETMAFQRTNNKILAMQDAVIAEMTTALVEKDYFVGIGKVLTRKVQQKGETTESSRKTRQEASYFDAVKREFERSGRVDND